MTALRFLPLLVLLAACDTVAVFPPEAPVSVEGLSLTTDRDAYQPDDSVTLTLSNETGEMVQTGVLACATRQRREASGWVDNHAQDPIVCAAVMVDVEPGEDYVVEVDLQGAAPGTYRFLEHTSAGDVATASFVVR